MVSPERNAMRNCRADGREESCGGLVEDCASGRDAAAILR